jgi:hypothetical protein
MTSLLAHRPRAVVFDVIQTTFSVEALRRHFTAVRPPAVLSRK